MEVAKREISNLSPTNAKDQVAARKAVLHLDKGLKAIVLHQKDTKIGDQLDLGWQVVAAYESNKLASNSNDEKRIFKAEKEAERRSKHKRAATMEFRKRVPFAKAAPMMPKPFVRTEGLSAPVGAARSLYSKPRQLGPCFGRGQWGQLVETCSTRTPKAGYPFQQSVIGWAEECSPVGEW